VLSTMHLAAGDSIRARAVLEAALEAQSEPLYRAMLLVRLGRLAALARAPDLAEHWLGRVPNSVRVPEIATEVRVVRALLDRNRNDAQAMLATLGRLDANVGAAKRVAMALAVDATERLGSLRDARRLYRQASHGDAIRFQQTIKIYGLAPRTYQRIVWAGFAALFLLMFPVATLGFIISQNLVGALVALSLAVVGVIVIKRF